MKKTIKALSLLGAVGALAACNGGTPLRSCSFNELSYAVNSDFINLMETSKLRHEDFHSEFVARNFESEGEISAESKMTITCDCSISQRIVVFNYETSLTFTGEEPEITKRMDAYFYDAEKGVLHASQEDDTKQYRVEISKESIQSLVNNPDSPYESVDAYLDMAFSEAAYEGNSYAFMLGGYMQMVMQYPETEIACMLPDFLTSDVVKTDGNHYFFDYEHEIPAEEDEEIKEHVNLISYHAEFDGMYPVSASFVNKETGKIADEVDPSKLLDVEAFSEIAVTFAFEFKGSAPDLTGYTFIPAND